MTIDDISNEDKVLLDKIKNKQSVYLGDITAEDRGKEICIGLNEVGKPPTLIWPRPIMYYKHEHVLIGSNRDDIMNIVLNKLPYEKILRALYDKSIVFKVKKD